MSEAYFIKLSGSLHPASDKDAEILSKFKSGDPVRVKLTRPRNYEFHKKYFSLLNFAFDYWEPPEADMPTYIAMKNITLNKSFDRFRKDIAILAGFYEASYRMNGEVRLEAKSVSFSKMSEDEFEELYTKTIDVIVQHVLPGQYTGDMLRQTVDMAMGYA